MGCYKCRGFNPNEYSNDKPQTSISEKIDGIVSNIVTTFNSVISREKSKDEIIDDLNKKPVERRKV